MQNDVAARRRISLMKRLDGPRIARIYQKHSHPTNIRVKNFLTFNHFGAGSKSRLADYARSRTALQKRSSRPRLLRDAEHFLCLRCRRRLYSTSVIFLAPYRSRALVTSESPSPSSRRSWSTRRPRRQPRRLLAAGVDRFSVRARWFWEQSRLETRRTASDPFGALTRPAVDEEVSLEESARPPATCFGLHVMTGVATRRGLTAGVAGLFARSNTTLETHDAYQLSNQHLRTITVRAAQSISPLSCCHVDASHLLFRGWRIGDERQGVKDRMAPSARSHFNL